LASFVMWCWKRTEKISWTDRVRNKGLLQSQIREDILRIIKGRKGDWIGHYCVGTVFWNTLLKKR
jgi:hypothetical protein